MPKKPAPEDTTKKLDHSWGFTVPVDLKRRVEKMWSDRLKMRYGKETTAAESTSTDLPSPTPKVPTTK
jgi:hypothetical protein